MLIVCAAAAAGLVLWEHWRRKRLLAQLDRMLENAIQGTFREERFDESRLSAVEARLAQYLAASASAARELQEEKDHIKALISDISHQTKTPIANLLLYVQLLEESLPDDVRVQALEAQTRKLQFLVDALVKTSRLETGILTLQPRPGLLDPVLEDAAAQFAPRAAEKGLALRLECRDIRAVFDPKWTAEAVCNLLDNAIKYTPSGSVTVRARAYSLFARIDVSDTGPGIPEEDHPRLFQRFYRGENARDTEGVGIGLYLVRQIAQGQGGYIRVFSRPGGGATFSLYLPT